jgi:tRNA-2-methylthio-N6-dimethylallyladenosine synthase
VQSGSDRILAAMKRGYTVLEFKSLVKKLKAARPDLSLSSDFIIGFPGETRRRLREDHAPGRGTELRQQLLPSSTARVPARPAADMADDTPQETRWRLMRLQKTIEAQA